MTQEDAASESQKGSLHKDACDKPAKIIAPSSTTVPGEPEPELLLEQDLPSDGRDEIGESMIRDLPQRSELTEPPSRSPASS